MNDEIDDFNDGLDFEDSDFEDFDNEEKTLGNFFENNPNMKIFVVVGVIVLVVLFTFVFGGEEEQTPESNVPSGSEISSPPATEEVPQSYREAIEEANQTRVEEALSQRTSALPTPIETPSTALTAPEEEEEEGDPLQRWKQLQEERLQKELAQASIVTPPAQENISSQASAEAVQTLAETMSSQMQVILETNTAEKQVGFISVTSPSILKQMEQERIAKEEAENSNDDEDEPTVLFPAGEIAYAQLLTEANSDLASPVLAEIVAGPLRGTRILGSLQMNEDQALITMNFDKAVVKGEVYPMNGIALDPATTLPGMATDVDRRYFQRIVLPAAAAFVEGAAQAISESGRTSIRVEGDTVSESTGDASNEQEIAAGIDEMGQEIREILDEKGDVPILVRIRAGTPFGLLFLENLTDSKESSSVLTSSTPQIQ